MAQTKATKKFESRHLKDTLERRKGLKKVKQKQQLKARHKSRKVEENTPADLVAASKPRPGRDGGKSSAFEHMNVDEFFQGGFEIPTQPTKVTVTKRPTGKRKRKRASADEEESDVSIEQAPVNGGIAESDSSDDAGYDDAGDDMEAHKQQLDALAEQDPDFHKYLQQNDAELLDFNAGNDELDGLELSEDDDEGLQKKKAKRHAAEDDQEVEDGNDLAMATVQKWNKAMSEQHSLRAAKEVVLAFRSAAHSTEEDGKAHKYAITDPEVYHSLLLAALKYVPEVLQHHLPVKETKGGKVKLAMDGRKWKSLSPIVKSFAMSVLHLLEGLSDASTLRITLGSLLALLPYLLSFKKLARDLTKRVVEVWSASSNTEPTRIAAFLVLRRLTLIGDAGIRENLLKQVYQGLIKASRSTTAHTLPGINLMKNSAAELWGIDTGVGYTTGFTMIRQLAIHLRQSITHNSNESYKTVYNWQYVHGLDFWSRVLSAHCTTTSSPDEPLGPLIYPVVQVTLGALRLIPTATYFPLRFQLVRSLLRMSLAIGTYIPLAPCLWEVLNSSEMRKAPKPSTLKPLDLATSIRTPKGYLRTRVYQDGLGEQVAELMSEFLFVWAQSIAFPELALPVLVVLKRWLRDANNRTPGQGNKNQKVNGGIKLLVEKIEANSRFVQQQREKVDFAPNNRAAVKGFLKGLEWTKTPLGAFVQGQRKLRAERERVVAGARRDEEARTGTAREERRAARGGTEVDGVENEDGDGENIEVEEEEGSD